MTNPTNRPPLPPGLRSAGDPVEGNPFPTDDPRHSIWREASLKAEEEVCRLNSEFLTTTVLGPRDFVARQVVLIASKYDIWAKRGIQIVWSENAVRAYDQWLFNYAQNWLEMAGDGCPEFVSREYLLVELRSRLISRVEHWKAEARRYLSVQRAHAAHPGDTQTSAQRKTVKPRDGDVAKRTTIVQNHADATASDLCEMFDTEKVPLPLKWRVAGFQSWSKTYKDSNYRSRIDVMLSKDRQK